jgi:hypothetical protein
MLMQYILRPREGVLKTHPKGSVYRNNAGFEADYIKVASAENAVGDRTYLFVETTTVIKSLQKYLQSNCESNRS